MTATQPVTLEVEAEGSVVVVVQSPGGSADGIVDTLPKRPPVFRAIGGRATRAKVGGIAEELGLDEVTEGTILIEDAQWADASSLGRLQRVVADPARNVLLVVAHRPLSGVRGWGIDRLAEAAGRHVPVHRVTVPDSGDYEVPLPTDLPGTDLIIGAGLASQSISVPVAAQLLDVSESEALETAERLVGEGVLRETRSGFSCAKPFRVGEARTGYVAGKLASALEAAGGPASVIGHLRLAAGDPAGAFDPLLTATREAERSLAEAEAFELAESALEAAGESGKVGGREIGHLHLACARFLRLAGRPDWAVSHVDQAVELLEGAERIDALGFAAALADDRQRPQEAERILAVGEWESHRLGEPAKHGSLTSLRARELHRIGFTAEADAMTEKAGTILASEEFGRQRYYAATNRAWISFDRGEAARAETEFSSLRTQASEWEGEASVADKTAWWARALFASGDPARGLEAVAEAQELADRSGVEGPLWVAELALAEGNLLYGRPEESLAAADRMHDLVEHQLPAWRNVAHLYRAIALFRLGQLDDAATEIDAALETTPSGADGWRYRVRCRAIQIEIATASGAAWPSQEAHDLADLMLQSRLEGWAAELLCLISENERRATDTAEVAMELALNIGNPMLAARAASAGKLWSQPSAAPVVRSIHRLEQRVPESWLDDWKGLTHVREALEAPEPGDLEDVAAESVALDRALRDAGLTGVDVVLSPAQRRSRGLVRRRRILRPLQIVAAGLAVVVLAGGTAFAVSQLGGQDSTPTTVATQPTVTTAPVAVELPLEETEIAVPVESLFGTSLDRGDLGRSGYVDVAGPRTVDGYYWKRSFAGGIISTPLSYGTNLLVGSADGTYQGVGLTDGSLQWRMQTEDNIATSAGLGSSSGGGAGPVSQETLSGIVVVVGTDGVVRARDAITVDTAEVWTTRIGDPIRSSPVVSGGMVYVATLAGRVYALDLTNGDIVWTYPAEDTEPLGSISAGLAMDPDAGVIYVGTEEGTLHLIDIDGTQVCQSTLEAGIDVNPVVTGGRAYISLSAANLILSLPAGVCEVSFSERIQYLSEAVVDIAPAVVGNLMYVANGEYLNAVDLDAVGQEVASPDEVHHWSQGKVPTEGKISSPPVVTQDAVYFGTETGVVYAVDSDTGDLLWQWQAGNYVWAAPVVIQGAVYIASGDGNVYAVGPANADG